MDLIDKTMTIDIDRKLFDSIEINKLEGLKHIYIGFRIYENGVVKNYGKEIKPYYHKGRPRVRLTDKNGKVYQVMLGKLMELSRPIF